MKMNKLLLAVFLPLLSLICGCAIPFEVSTTDLTLTLPGISASAEFEVPVPAEARKSGVTIDQVTIEYTAENMSAAATDVTMYMALTKPPTSDADRTNLLNITLTANEKESGACTNDVVKQAMSHESFTIGITRTNGSSEVKLTIKVKIKGSSKLI